MLLRLLASSVSSFEARSMASAAACDMIRSCDSSCSTSFLRASEFIVKLETVFNSVFLVITGKAVYEGFSSDLF